MDKKNGTSFLFDDDDRKIVECSDPSFISTLEYAILLALKEQNYLSLSQFQLAESHMRCKFTVNPKDIL